MVKEDSASSVSLSLSCVETEPKTQTSIGWGLEVEMGDEVSGDGHCQSHAKFEEQKSPVLHSYLQQPLHPRSFMTTMVIPSSYDQWRIMRPRW